MQGKSLKELAEHVGGEVRGDGNMLLKRVSTLENAGEGEITFLSNKKYEPLLKTTNASAVIVAKPAETKAALLVTKDPYYAFMQIVVLLHGHRKHKKVGISERASVAKTAKLGTNCDVYDFAVISDGAQVGKNCCVYPGAFVGPDVKMGDDCVVYPNAAIYDGCEIGDRVIIHANAAVGEDGYGFATHKGEHHKIPQIGRVVLEDDVEVGACCTIERATLDDTIIGKGTKVGDMVAIGHGAKIGPHCLLVPQVGISGSTTLGHHCVLGGQVGVVGHIKIGDMVTIGAQAGVINDVPDRAKILGSPAIEASKAKRAYALIEYLPDMRRSIRKLEKRLGELEKSDNE
ncbi:MAG: UDP-3-O-(3-hydroxymyristoyl)glucosamine N-acyltransferase [Planctomycetota bacterium]|jgi:UDP-3-O-[3-hydroxymyristoyl] glucosamine N-acyltransferase